MQIDYEKILQCAKKEMAKRHFFDFCNLMAPKFYKQNLKYLVDMCNTLEQFINQSSCKVLIIDLPP